MNKLSREEMFMFGVLERSEIWSLDPHRIVSKFDGKLEVGEKSLIFGMFDSEEVHYFLGAHGYKGSSEAKAFLAALNTEAEMVGATVRFRAALYLPLEDGGAYFDCAVRHRADR